MHYLVCIFLNFLEGMPPDYPPPSASPAVFFLDTHTGNINLY